MERTDVLAVAGNLIAADRAAQYGDSRDTHERVAQMWSAILGHEVSATDVALMMVCLKCVRAAKNPQYADSWIDIAGYSALGAEIAGSN